MTLFHVVAFLAIFAILLIFTVFGLTRKIAWKFSTILLIGIALRIVTIFLFQNLIHYDFLASKAVGEAILRGHNIYIDLAYPDQPFLPFLQYLYAPSIWLSHLFGQSHMFYLKIVYSSFDILALYLVYLLSNKNKTAAFLYAFNPGYFLLSAAHGHTDIIPMTALLLALYFLKQKKGMLSALFLGFGILVETWPGVLLFFFLKYAKKKLFYLIFALIVPAIFVLLYALLFHATIVQIIYPVLSYRGGYGGWGISIIPALFNDKVPQAIIKIISNLTLFLLLAFFLMRKSKDLGKDIYFFLLAFSVFSISGAQPLWLLPFVLLFQPKQWKYWIILIGFYQGVTVFQEVMYAITIPFALILSKVQLFVAFMLFLMQVKFLFGYRHELLPKNLKT